MLSAYAYKCSLNSIYSMLRKEAYIVSASYSEQLNTVPNSRTRRTHPISKNKNVFPALKKAVAAYEN